MLLVLPRPPRSAVFVALRCSVLLLSLWAARAPGCS